MALYKEQTGHFNFRNYISPEVANGIVGSLVGILATYPLDLIKTRLQNQQYPPHGLPKYKGIIHCFMKIVQKENFGGLHYGLPAFALCSLPERYVFLVSNEWIRKKLANDDGLPLHRQLLACGLTGLMQTIITTPLELLKVQMQDYGRRLPYGHPTSRQVFGLIFRNYGLTGIYRGMMITALRDVTFPIFFFPIFLLLHHRGIDRKDSGVHFYLTSYATGMIACILASLLVAPFDCIKTRLQTIEKLPGERNFRGIRDAFRRTIKSEGYRGLYKGALCRCLAIPPRLAIAHYVYEEGLGEYLHNFLDGISFYLKKPANEW